MSQRDLAAASGVAQPAIARLEAGRISPTVDTLEHLLAACGMSFDIGPRLGEGVDRTAIRELLRLTPAERLELAVEEARNLSELGL